MFSFVTFASLVMRTSMLSSFTVFLISVISGLDNPPAFHWMMHVSLHVLRPKKDILFLIFLAIISVLPELLLIWHQHPWGTYSFRNAVDVSNMFQNFVDKIEFSLKSDKNSGTLREDRYTFFITSHSVLLRLEMFQAQVVEKMETHILCWITPPPPNQAVYEIVW